MSETDSFIEEVTDEVRRDNLFKLFKKYSWVLILIVIGIVGGTAYNELNKSNQQKRAQLNGDIMRTALTANHADGLVTITNGDTPAAVLARFQQSAILADNDDIPAAVAALQLVANDADLSDLYTDLAWLKILMLSASDMDADERAQVIANLTLETAPYRLLAIEQRALQNIRDGKIDTALDDLAMILADETVSDGLENRAQQLTISLGGDLAGNSTDG
ncbi:MAG: hypothetical protein JKY31_08725 [Rhodobacteraceae bacterium]|nr:hypothetical protein [Paracoccaceae bacterium]